MKLKLFVVLLLTALIIGCVNIEKEAGKEKTEYEKQEKVEYKTEYEEIQQSEKGFTNFSSDAEFRAYLYKSRSYGYPVILDVAGSVAKAPMVTPMPEVTPTPMPTPIPTPAQVGGKYAYESTPERYSTTNVQVAGIDEPDIVKTDGKNIYFSSRFYPFRYMPYENLKTRVIAAFPPENLTELFKLEDSGELLLMNGLLVVIGHDHISAYSTENGKELWKIKLESEYVSARLYSGKIYLVTRSWIDSYQPCPIKPVTVEGKPYTVSCREIYHPVVPVYSDVVYNVMIINESGKIEKSTSFVGSISRSVVYMSSNAIYVTYHQTIDPADMMYSFLMENKDLLPEKVIDRIKTLKEYNISKRAKYVEIQEILNEYKRMLSKDERLKFENEFWNRMEKYRDEHKRELEKTQIVKISTDLEPLAVGEVPGDLLNQFSMDEYKGFLRVAVTLGDTNDLYVLDSNMNVVGYIMDFGEDERIFAVRFIADKGYVVTFRQTDPFFVMDLSNPYKPEIKGELKIPGFSSYLHPISDTIILGIGKEGSKVKISLFDVSDVESPKEIDRYILDEWWTDVLNNHHAFLLDKKHEIFFLPGGKGGYIFSYKDDKLKMERAVDMQAVRAIYINDFLYVIGDKIVVIDERTWKDVNELDLT
ncbi:Secreted protein containing C-terminal beta-propeller domain distantly related to WD-40 repeats [Archaeoglobus sulfaticallidus PM70-1]|uniref:Secreted protein containing C-terminal beta-propeller domain distantly related to WD-40 repeats n=1 Tax=Archaeoglobus sulfaticallidus PM70-1 TaxID=387631 RepID=N0BL48_9EURY|nr:beta-propeller domain-containing protein [Archaeoglobus sulfaticallidus]AGK61266.1 Secreted protein containing C-terminal beta-propeller domain distantly related to WD-40 repeats [Archaeoglobus sulfaticallidus PM70-1]